MKLKFKLISTIASACLVIALLITGVWAVSTASVTLGGTISFSATNVHAEITGTITGAQETVTIEKLTYNSETNENGDAFKNALKTWTNNLTFAGSPIQMSITVKNLSEERDLYVKVTDNTNVTNLTDTLDFTSAEEVKVEKGGSNTTTFNITLSVADTDESVDGQYAYNVDLADDSTKIPPTVLDSNKEANGIYYSLSTDGSKTAIATAMDGDYVTDIKHYVIPAQVIYEQEVYTVIGLESQGGINSQSSIISFEIPKTIERIGPSYICYCENLISIIINAEIPPEAYDPYDEGWGFAYDCHPDLTIYVPDASVDAYKTANGWSGYAEIIKPISQKNS